MISSKYDFISREDETALIIEYQANKSEKAISKLISSHMPLIKLAAYKKRNYLSVASDDLIQEGIIGFISAVGKFDVSKSNRLCTYATYFVNMAMLEFVMKNSTHIKFTETKPNRKIFFNIGKYRNSDGYVVESSVRKMSEELNVSETDIRSMDVHLNTSYCNVSIDNEEMAITDDYEEPSNVLARRQTNFDLDVGLNMAIDNLDDRAGDIIRSRYLSDKKVTMKELGGKYGLSAERIRQIEEASLIKLRKEFKPSYFVAA